MEHEQMVRNVQRRLRRQVVANAIKDHDGGLRLLAVVVFAICTGVISNVITGALLGWTSESSGVHAFAIAFSIAYLLFGSLAVVLVLTQLRQIRRRIGLNVKYVELTSGQSQSEIYQQVAEYLQLARESIVVVNGLLPEIHAEDSQSRLARERYFETLRHVAKTKYPFFYKRVWQLESFPDYDTMEAELLVHWNTVEICSHVREIVKQRKTHDDSSVMFAAPATRLGTYILIDDDRLIWQISEYVNPSETDENHRNAKAVQVKGVFLIHDPHRSITGHFKDSTLRLLQRAHLISWKRMEDIEARASLNINNPSPARPTEEVEAKPATDESAATADTGTQTEADGAGEPRNDH